MSTCSLSVLDQISVILNRGGCPAFSGTKACREYRLRAVRSGGALLGIPLKGAKRIHSGSAVWEVAPGAALLVCRDCSFDNENIPDPVSGDFLTAILTFPDTVLNVARTLVGQEPLPEPASSRAIIGVVSLEQIVGPLETYLGVGEQPSFLLQHALVGLVLHLYGLGHRALLQLSRPRLADRICELISKDPSREWRSAELESLLAMSGPSLRRQLAFEKTSLRELLAEARLSQALWMLQTTRLPIKTVAARSGYSSVSSFVRRFHLRYGVEPSKVSCT